MSTDTAFALGLLTLFGRRAPDRLRAFMLTVVIADDLLALVVIALVYSDSIDVMPLIWAGGLFAVALVLPRARAAARAAVLRGDVERTADGCEAAVFTAAARHRWELAAVDSGGSAKLA